MHKHCYEGGSVICSGRCSLHVSRRCCISCKGQ